MSDENNSEELDSINQWQSKFQHINDCSPEELNNIFRLGQREHRLTWDNIDSLLYTHYHIDPRQQRTSMNKHTDTPHNNTPDTPEKTTREQELPAESHEDKHTRQQLNELAHYVSDLARHGKTDELIQYISLGAPVDLPDPDGNTLVMLASYHGHVETTKALLSLQADPNIMNNRNQTPLAGAVFKGYYEVGTVLVKNGANPFLSHPDAYGTAEIFGNLEKWKAIFAQYQPPEQY